MATMNKAAFAAMQIRLLDTTENQLPQFTSEAEAESYLEFTAIIEAARQLQAASGSRQGIDAVINAYVEKYPEAERPAMKALVLAYIEKQATALERAKRVLRRQAAEAYLRSLTPQTASRDVARAVKGALTGTGSFLSGIRAGWREGWGGAEARKPLSEDELKAFIRSRKGGNE